MSPFDVSYRSYWFLDGSHNQQKCSFWIHAKIMCLVFFAFRSQMKHQNLLGSGPRPSCPGRLVLYNFQTVWLNLIPVPHLVLGTIHYSWAQDSNALGCRPTEQHQDPLEEVVLVGSQMDSEAVQFEVGMIRLWSELHHIFCKFEDEQNQ